MKTEDERLIREFCSGKVIAKVEFPTAHAFRIVFESSAGIEISEQAGEAKGLVVRMVHTSKSSSD
jgi:hypothetical protein